MDKIIAQNLKKLRETAHYTQEEISRILGISRSAYSNYESGDREAPYEVLEKISNFFGCDMSTLFQENQNIDALILISAFRVDEANEKDAAEIIHFKDVVKSYLKMDAIIKDESFTN